MTPRRLVLWLLPLAALVALAVAPGCASSRSAPAEAAERAGASPLLGLDKMSIVNNGHGNGNRSFANRDWPGAAEAFARAYAFNHGDDVAVYLLAATAARAGKPEAALEWLQRLWQMGSCLVPVSRSFASIESDIRFRDVDAILRAEVAKEHRASVAFTVGERDLAPEGIAYDPRDEVFYLSSVWKRKIVRVKPGLTGAPAAVEDFVPEGADGLDAVLGIKVDAARRRIWAVTASEPDMKGFVKEDFGRSALCAWDLESRKLVRRVTFPPGPPHLFNDLALDRAGNVYVTDAVAAEIYVLTPGATDLATFVAKERFFAPSGIAVSDDDACVYVADAAQGVFRVDAGTRSVAPLDQPPGLFPTGLDGLVIHDGTLVGVMNLVSVGRVSRWRLSADGSALDAGEVLECGHPAFRTPARGVVVGSDLYFVANSQIDSVSGTEAPPTNLVDIVILKLRL